MALIFAADAWRAFEGIRGYDGQARRKFDTRSLPVILVLSLGILPQSVLVHHIVCSLLPWLSFIIISNDIHNTILSFDRYLGAYSVPVYHPKRSYQYLLSQKYVSDLQRHSVECKDTL